MVQPKIQGKFYPLQHDEWLKACKELSNGAKDVLYYIRTVDPYSNGIELTAAAIARKLGCNRSTVSRAFLELKNKSYIDMDILVAKVRVTGKGLLGSEDFQEEGEPEAVAELQHGQELGDVAKMQQRCKNATASAKTQHAPQKRNTLRKNATRSAVLQQVDAETLAPRDFPDSKTSLDFSKNNQTLSEAIRERNMAIWENIDESTRRDISYFAYQVAIPKLPIRPTLPDAWIICHCVELHNQMMYDVEFQRKLAKISANSSSVENQRKLAEGSTNALAPETQEKLAEGSADLPASETEEALTW